MKAFFIFNFRNEGLKFSEGTLKSNEGSLFSRDNSFKTYSIVSGTGTFVNKQIHFVGYVRIFVFSIDPDGCIFLNVFGCFE